MEAQYHHTDENSPSPYGDSEAQAQETGTESSQQNKRKFHVPYTESLAQMTQSLSIFNELLDHKKEERDQLELYKEELMLAIKHVKEETFVHKAIQANFIRQSNFTDKFKQRHKRGNFFQEKEKKEITDVNPGVSNHQFASFSDYH